MAGRSLPLNSVGTDLTALRDRLSSNAVRELLQREDGELGPLGKVIVVFRALNEHMRLSAGDMAARLWEALSDQQILFTRREGEDQQRFVKRMVRWFRPSQKHPYASLTRHQGAALEEAASKVAEELLGEPIRGLLRQRWKSADQLAGKLKPAKLASSSGIDPKLQKSQPLFDPTHLPLVGAISDYLVTEGKDVDFLCIVGEPHSGQEIIISQAIERYLRKEDCLPVFARLCGELQYTQVAVEVVRFIENSTPAQSELALEGEGEKLKMIRERAQSLPAVYIFVDLELLNSDPARNLIRQQDVVELIDVLSQSNPKTKVIISCKELPNDVDGMPVKVGYYSWQMSVEWACVRVFQLAPPTTESLFRSVHGLYQNEALSRLAGLFPSDPLDGVALDLCAAVFAFFDGAGALEKGVEVVTELLTGARENGEKLKPVPVFKKFWSILPGIHRLLCVIIAASDDGVREKSLKLTLKDLVVGGLLTNPPSEDETRVALEELHAAFDGTLRREEYRPEWVLDDLPGEPRREALFEFHRLIRRTILATVEGLGREEHRLVQCVHRSISKRARTQAYNRRLNGLGVYGTRLRDLSRDIQALLSLVASADIQGDDMTLSRDVMPPLDVEREVFCGHAGGRTALRFAFLQMWRQDIDRDYRLNTVHAVDELRLHVLLAMVTSPGRSFFPSRLYQVSLDEIDGLSRVFSVAELLDFLTSLAIAAYQSGAFNVVGVVKNYAERLRDGNPVLRAKLLRAHVDATILADRAPNLSEIEQDLREMIDSFGDSPAEKQARLKLYLRLGDICYLQGTKPTENGRTKRDDAREAFDSAISLEKDLAGGEDCPPGRALISGIGARRFLRAELNWAMAELRDAKAKHRECDWLLVDRHIQRARDVHRISLRRLSRHGADRAGILLDEARIHFVEAYKMGWGSGDNVQKKAYSTVKDLIMKAHVFVIQPGLPIATKLDLDGQLVRIGTELAQSRLDGITGSEAENGTYSENEMLETCERSLVRLLRIAEQFDLQIYKAYALLLRFKFRLTRHGKSVVEEPGECEKLQAALHICDRVGLGIYRQEINECLGLFGFRA